MRSRSHVGLGLFLIAACGCGVQRGMYSSATQETVALAGALGSVNIVYGQELGWGGFITGQDRPLLYFLFICPGTGARRTAWSANHGESKASFSESWGEGGNALSLKLVWDREDDQVLIGDSRYDRARGNVFVVSQRDKEHPKSLQLSGAA